jgi:uncharacterized membrane protein
MKLPIFRLWETARSSYWFVPTVMALAAIVLGIAAVWFDTATGNSWLSALSWAQKSKPEAAREMLSAIASSMITVAGVVFSITIVAIAYAAGQYGPRILTNFMSDRGNQLTLGTFIATFVYSLIVMRTIHSGDGEFVPQSSVLLGILLALCSIAVLIYFIHHVPISIHVNSLVSRIGRQLLDQIESRDDDSGETERDAPTPDSFPTAVCSASDGYVEAISTDDIVSLARESDLIVRICKTPGDFVHEGSVFARVYGDAADDTCDAMRSAFAVGSRRTPYEDELFLVDELVEIAARALSPGVNDPYTAMTCLDWLGAAMAKLARKPSIRSTLTDCDGALRVIRPATDFAAVTERAFGRTRPYAARDVNATVHALNTYAEIARDCESREQVQAMSRQSELLLAAAKCELSGPSKDSVEQVYRQSCSAFAATA